MPDCRFHSFFGILNKKIPPSSRPPPIDCLILENEEGVDSDDWGLFGWWMDLKLRTDTGVPELDSEQRGRFPDEKKTLKSPAGISLYVRRPEIFGKKSRGGRWKAFPYIYYIVQTRFHLNKLARGHTRPNSCFFCRCAVIWAARTLSFPPQLSRTPHQLEKNLFFVP